MSNADKHVVIVSGLFNHYNCVESLLAAFKHLGCRLSIVVLANVEKRLSAEMLEGVSVHFTGVESRTTYHRYWDLFQSADLLILDEPYSVSLLTYLALKLHTLKAPTVMMLHNVNAWFFPKYALQPKSLLKTVLRRAIASRLKTFIITASNVYAYAKEHVPGKSFYYIPSRRPVAQSTQAGAAARQDGPMRLVLPGVVARKRDYRGFLDEVLSDREIGRLVDCTLLGKADDSYGDKIIAECRQLAQAGHRITVFSEFIPNDIYHQYLAQADCVLCLNDVTFHSGDGQVERYGLTKETGASYLALAYGKPLILHDEYNPLTEMRGQLLTYHTLSDLRRLLIDLATAPADLEPYSRAARDNLSRFNITTIAEGLRPMLPWSKA